MAFGQKRPVTVIHDNVMFNYSITRYVPVWEVQSGKKGQEGLLSQHKSFFNEVTGKGLDALKGLIFSKALVPEHVKPMDAKSMETFLASNALVIHYRVQYKDYSIFLAHLNNSPTRSVIPFLVDGGKWILDPSFAETDFYKLLSARDFDPYMGIKDGQVVCSFGFEEVVDMTRFYDYSGSGNHLTIRSAAIVDGRFGGALKLNGASVGSSKLHVERSSNGTTSVDMHLQIPKMVYNTEKIRRVFSMASNGSVMKLEVMGAKLRFTYPSATGDQHLEWKYVPDAWAHIDLLMNESGVSVQVDGRTMATSSLLSTMRIDGALLNIGAEGGAKAQMDEFRITQ